MIKSWFNFVIDVMKLIIDPSYYAKTMNELEKRKEAAKIAEEIVKRSLEDLRRSRSDDLLGIKQFGVRPSAWLEDLARKGKE